MSFIYFGLYTLCFPEILSKSMRNGNQSSHTVKLRASGRGKALSLYPEIPHQSWGDLSLSDLAIGRKDHMSLQYLWGCT